MPIYDFTCPDCGHTVEQINTIAEAEAGVKCPECDAVMERAVGAPHTFTTIIPMYPGSKQHKAGYVHQFGNRPAEKTQVGYGGGVSVDHPTGSTKNKD